MVAQVRDEILIFLRYAYYLEEKEQIVMDSSEELQETLKYFESKQSHRFQKFYHHFLNGGNNIDILYPNRKGIRLDTSRKHINYLMTSPQSSYVHDGVVSFYGERIMYVSYQPAASSYQRLENMLLDELDYDVPIFVIDMKNNPRLMMIGMATKVSHMRGSKGKAYLFKIDLDRNKEIDVISKIKELKKCTFYTLEEKKTLGYYI